MEFYFKAATIGILVVGVLEYMRHRFSRGVKINIDLGEEIEVPAASEAEEEGLTPFQWAVKERKRLSEAEATRMLDKED